MGAKDKLKQLRERAKHARLGRVIEVDGLELKIIAPTVKQMDGWKDGDTTAGEILRSCVADPDSGELLFADATDEELDECSMGLVMACTQTVKAMMEDAAGNFPSTKAES